MRIVLVADLHVGHLVGLCTPTAPMREGGTYKASAFQKRLYAYWKKCAQGKWHRPDCLVCLGDAIDGQGRRRHGVEQWTTDILDQIEVAHRLLRMWDAKRYVVIRGTGYHVDINGMPGEEILARRLDAEIVGNRAEDGEPARSAYVVDLEVEGITINLAHHLGFTSIWQYRSTAITREMLLRKIADRLLDQMNRKPCRVIARAHVHFLWHVESINTHGFIVPAWVGLTPFMLTRATLSLPDVGFWGLDIKKGRITYEKEAKHVETVGEIPRVCLDSPRTGKRNQGATTKD